MDKALRSLLDWYAAVGVDVPDIAPSRPAPRKRPATMRPSTPKVDTRAAPPRPAAPKPEDRVLKPSAPIAEAAKTLTDLQTSIEKFDAGILSDGARQAVFARGNPAADLMVIGEAPGRDEDIAGKPFVGRSGQLLDRMLAAIGLGEDDFYVTNVVNWRPPQDRNPLPEEIEMCRPFILRHIEHAAPKTVLLVGGVSMQAMTGLTSIMKNRGQWQTLSIGGSDIPALPIFHPAFLLRRPELKKEAWQDLLKLREALLTE